MNRITSSIGESKFGGQGQRRFVVGEDTVTQPPPPMSAQQIDPAVVSTMRRQAQEHQDQAEQRQLSDARRRIEIIVGLGRQTKEVPIETNNGLVTFTLRTLKTREQNSLAQVLESAEKLMMPDGTMVFSPTSLAKIRLEALSHSLFLVDGQSIDIVLGTANDPYEVQVSARKDLIQEMDHALINHLFSNYEILTKETYDGYIPKTVEEAKEVVDTISKSGENA